MFVGSGASALTSPCPSPPAGRPRHSLASATPQDYAPVLQLQMVYKGCWVVQVAVAMARGAARWPVAQSHGALYANMNTDRVGAGTVAGSI